MSTLNRLFKGAVALVRQLYFICPKIKHIETVTHLKAVWNKKNKEEITMQYYGVSQMCHGHEYRWVFDEETLKNKLNVATEEILELSGTDLFFPIGGSNCSCTWIQKLDDNDEIKGFLVSDGEGPDAEDPMLVDLAEYILTISTGDDSCTQDFLTKFGLDAQSLEKFDDAQGRCKKVEIMAKELQGAGYKGLDYNNVFYGENSDMQYSELCDLYEKYTGKFMN